MHDKLFSICVHGRKVYRPPKIETEVKFYDHSMQYDTLHRITLCAASTEDFEFLLGDTILDTGWFLILESRTSHERA